MSVERRSSPRFRTPDTRLCLFSAEPEWLDVLNLSLAVGSARGGLVVCERPARSFEVGDEVVAWLVQAEDAEPLEVHCRVVRRDARATPVLVGMTYTLAEPAHASRLRLG